jgi:predicted aminopeptidase
MVRMLTESAAGGPSHRVGVRVPAARALLLGVCCTLLSGCASVYLVQAAAGEWRVLRARVPIDSVVADPRTPSTVRERLTGVRAAREFASRELGLPDNKSYRTYADIRRPFVVWNVVAAPEFSVTPKHWCFPVAGCVAYRGYFKERRAREFAAALAVRGYDVVVDGVPAYSTLGRFADPVLSSMLRYGDDDLAATIFHELAHQLLYVRGDSQFNEAFATTVEEVGLTRWLEAQGAADRIARLRADQAMSEAVIGLLETRRARLAPLYATQLPRAAMRAQKAALLAQLAADINALEQRQRVHYPLYDEWIARGLNNADLVSVATYFACVPGFRRLLAHAGGDLPRFYDAVRALAREPRPVRHATLCSGALAPGPAQPEAAPPDG